MAINRHPLCSNTSHKSALLHPEIHLKFNQETKKKRRRKLKSQNLKKMSLHHQHHHGTTASDPPNRPPVVWRRYRATLRRTSPASPSFAAPANVPALSLLALFSLVAPLRRAQLCADHRRPPSAIVVARRTSLPSHRCCSLSPFAGDIILLHACRPCSWSRGI